jgi:hypothetical protein
MAAPNPCLQCGACCTQFSVRFYWRESDEFTPGGVPAGLTQFADPHHLRMKGTDGSSPRCVALYGEIGKEAGCSIHLNRPSVCRDFPASYSEGEPNERCDRARARFGLRPLTPQDWIDPSPEG